MENKSTLHCGHRQRLIERFLRYPESLSDHELLELLLFFAIPRQNTNPTAHKLLDGYKTLGNILSSDTINLSAVNGIGRNAACLIRVVGEIAARAQKSEELPILAFSYQNSKTFIEDCFKGLFNEKMFVFFLDEKGKLLTRVEATDNDRSHVLADTSEVAKAIAASSPRFALMAHNHPSGNPTPTENDDIATGKIHVLCALHGVTLSDHIIVSKNQSYSYFTHGRMDIIRQNFNIDNILHDTIDNLGE